MLELDYSLGYREGAFIDPLVEPPRSRFKMSIPRHQHGMGSNENERDRSDDKKGPPIGGGDDPEGNNEKVLCSEIKPAAKMDSKSDNERDSGPRSKPDAKRDSEGDIEKKAGTESKAVAREDSKGDNEKKLSLQSKTGDEKESKSDDQKNLSPKSNPGDKKDSKSDKNKGSNSESKLAVKKDSADENGKDSGPKSKLADKKDFESGKKKDSRSESNLADKKNPEGDNDNDSGSESKAADGEDPEDSNEEDFVSESEPDDEAESKGDEKFEREDGPAPVSARLETSPPPVEALSFAARSQSNYPRPAASGPGLLPVDSVGKEGLPAPKRTDRGTEKQAQCSMTGWTKSEKDAQLLRELSGKKGIDKLKHIHKETTGFLLKMERLVPALTYAAQHALPFSLMELLLVQHAGWDETDTSGPLILKLLVDNARCALGDQWIGILATLLWIHIEWVKDLDAKMRAKYPPLADFVAQNRIEGSQLIDWKEAVRLAKDLILRVGLKELPVSSKMNRVNAQPGRRWGY